MKIVKNNPLISIIMPVLNAEAFLPEALDSVLTQTYQNWELICVDNGSVDASFSILRGFAARDSRIKPCRSASRNNVSAAANHGLSLAQGRFVGRFDADDLMPPRRLEQQVEFLLQHPRVVVVGGQVELMDIKGQPLGLKRFPTQHQQIYSLMFTAMGVQQGAMLVNTALLPGNFIWYQKVDSTAEEVDFFFRVLKYGCFANLTQVVLRYRQYPASTSLKDPKKTFYKTLRSRFWAVRNHGYHPTAGAWLINLLQLLTVTFLPNKLIYPVFGIARGSRRPRFLKPLKLFTRLGAKQKQQIKYATS